jgi:hypothetical protein
LVDASSDLKKKILGEMTVNYSDNLQKNFEMAKQFIRITRDGQVDILNKDKLSGTEQIQLYLIGKMYAKEAELATTDEAGNNELMEQLSIPVGSLLPWLKQLRDAKKIKQVKRERNVYHRIPVNLIEGTLKTIERKLHKKV